jgi:hypothetical protein
VWGGPERNPWAAKVAGVLVEHAHMAPPAEGAPGIFALADPAQIETLVREAGFERPRIVEVEMTWRFQSFDDYWAYTLEAAGALAMVIEQLAPHNREAVRAAVRDRLDPLADDGVELDGVCLNAFTTAPL